MEGPRPLLNRRDELRRHHNDSTARRLEDGVRSERGAPVLDALGNEGTEGTSRFLSVPSLFGLWPSGLSPFGYDIPLRRRGLSKATCRVIGICSSISANSPEIENPFFAPVAHHALRRVGRGNPHGFRRLAPQTKPMVAHKAVIGVTTRPEHD